MSITPPLSRHRLAVISIAATYMVCWLPVSSGYAQAQDERFTALSNEIWEYGLREDPLWATSTGDHRYNDQLPQVSLADSTRRHEARRQFVSQLEAVDRSQHSPAEQVNYDILRRQLKVDLAEFDFKSHLIPISQREGFHIDFPNLPNLVPLETLRDYENYVARLRAFGDYADGNIALLRAGMAAGQTLPAVVLEGWEQAVEAHVVDKAEQSLLFEPAKKFSAAISEADQQRLKNEISQAIDEVVVPAYQRFRTFMADEYVPQARGSIGASALADGRDFYRHRVRRFTTLDLTPEEVHQTGLAEVKRIRAEMQQIIERVEFDGDFAAFVKFLRTDPQFYADTEEELLEVTALVLKRMDGSLPSMFGKLPRTPYGLREIPAYIAPRTTSAYYQPLAGDGSKAGFFYLNTYNLKNRPLYTIEALAFHEAVPGHHLQIALQQEMQDLPTFRRFTSFTAYVEGWALYAERLGIEAGFYQDPYSDFGRLTMEMWRACRLVVDTGIHYFGWTRSRAIEFMADNSALSDHNIRSEVDRYISWPGQALGYKMGELKIRELRKQAETELGDKFNVRAFHDMVLSTGSVPLDIVDAKTRAWIEAQRQ